MRRLQRLHCRACAVILAGVFMAAIAGCAATRRERTGFYVDDAAIASRIRSEMAADRDLESTSIRVDSRDGTVTLSGFVPSTRQRQIAGSIAMKIRGVKLLKNEIAVRS